MSGELNKADRVRISWQNRLPRYQPGDKGTVWEKWDVLEVYARYYLVLLDKDDPPQPVLFTEDEIEPVGTDAPSASTGSL